MSKAFTLIELLVVVLIIGILASVALPQYQKAVEKSRQTEAWTTMKSIMDAMKIVQMENGANVVPRWDDLVLQFTNETGSVVANSNATSYFTTKDWEYSIPDHDFVTATRRGGIAQYTLSLNEDGERCCWDSKENCAKAGANTKTTVSCAWNTGYPFD